MIETDTVIAILECEHALDFVRLDHRCQYIMHRQWSLARRPILPAQIIRHGEDAAEIVGWMSPFGGEPGVVEVKPAVHCADVERRHNRFELVRRSRNSRTARQCGACNDGAKQLGAGREVQCLKTAGKRVHETVMRNLVGKLAIDALVADKIGDVGKLRVPVRTLRRAHVNRGHDVSATSCPCVAH